MQRSEPAPPRVYIAAKVIDDHGDELVVEVQSQQCVMRMFVLRKDVTPMEKAA